MSSNQKDNPGFFSRLFKRAVVEIPAERRPPLIFDKPLPMPDNVHDLAEPCFCGSDKLFKSCCGSREERRSPPYGVFVFRQYVDAGLLTRCREFADSQAGERLMVIDPEASTPGNIVKKVDDRRVSEYVDLQQYFDEINNVVKKAFSELAPEYFKRQVEWYERPHMMRYHPGGFYQGHADSQNMDPDTRVWNKVIDRDISLLIYLNEDFEGGELYFDKFNYRLKPQAGMLVMFPSDYRYMHTAETVEEGVRYAIVSWASVKGVQKISNKTPENVFYL